MTRERSRTRAPAARAPATSHASRLFRGITRPSPGSPRCLGITLVNRCSPSRWTAALRMAVLWRHSVRRVIPSDASSRIATGLTKSPQTLSRGKARESATMTRRPAAARCVAAAAPAGPAPATIASQPNGGFMSLARRRTPSPPPRPSPRIRARDGRVRRIPSGKTSVKRRHVPRDTVGRRLSALPLGGPRVDVAVRPRDDLFVHRRPPPAASRLLRRLAVQRGHRRAGGRDPAARLFELA